MHTALSCSSSSLELHVLLRSKVLHCFENTAGAFEHDFQTHVRHIELVASISLAQTSYELAASKYHIHTFGHAKLFITSQRIHTTPRQPSHILT